MYVCVYTQFSYFCQVGTLYKSSVINNLRISRLVPITGLKEEDVMILRAGQDSTRKIVKGCA